jgi:hypothetical protein
MEPEADQAIGSARRRRVSVSALTYAPIWATNDAFYSLDL